MVLHRHGKALYEGLVAVVSEHLREVVAPAIERAEGDGFLVELERRWRDHTKSTRMIRDILMYMDRVYVPPHGLKPTHDLGLALWRDEVCRLPSINRRLLAAVLGAIERERRGERIDQSLVRAATSMLMDCGEETYARDFEEPFLGATREFYRRESQRNLQACDCHEYLKRSERRLEEEHARVKAYLNARTEARVVTETENELLSRRMEAALGMPSSGLRAMLAGDKHEQLALVYRLYSRVEGGLGIVKEMMARVVEEEGKALVADPERAKDPNAFVEGLLRTKAKYDRTIAAAFASDRNFVNATHKAFEHFVNLNARSPEYISLYVDDKLRKGLKGASEEEVEATLDEAMSLFRFLQEKDVFERYYKQHLAKRLLSGRSTSDDAERSFIVKLKTDCGYQFTSKIEGMFNDMRTSRDAMAAFRTHLAEDAREKSTHSAQSHSQPSGSGRGDAASSQPWGFDLGVQVLTTGSWPMPTPPPCALPPECESACEAYRAFYLASHTGRRLNWLTNAGTADLRATFADGVKRELSVSTYQMCVLMLFNAQDALSYSDILAATRIPEEDLKRSLQSLACVKGRNVLRKIPMSKEVNVSDVFEYNEQFTSKLLKVKIGTVSASKETEPEKTETKRRVDDDRKPQIEAAIVRVMKARRRLDHNGVVQEVTKQLSARFIPNPTDIKKHLENLIEREFIERDRNDRKTYVYLA
jgi:cullin 3